jgi:hypothetical protein
MPITVQSTSVSELEANSSYTIRTLKVVKSSASETFALTGGYPISILSIVGLLPASQGVTISIGSSELFSIPSSVASDLILDVTKPVNVMAASLVDSAGNLTVDTDGTPSGTLYITIAQKGAIS